MSISIHFLPQISLLFFITPFANIPLSLVLTPIVYPRHDPVNITPQMLHGLALELHDYFWLVSLSRLIKYDIHDLRLIVFLDFFQRITSVNASTRLAHVSR